MSVALYEWLAGDLTLCGGAGCIINWLADGTDSFGDEPFVAAGD